MRRAEAPAASASICAAKGARGTNKLETNALRAVRSEDCSMWQYILRPIALDRLTLSLFMFRQQFTQRSAL
jgi:hypothetical protein